MRCLDALPVAERERRVQWAELQLAKANAQALVTSAARLVAAAGEGEMSAALDVLSKAVLRLDVTEDAILVFREEQS